MGQILSRIPFTSGRSGPEEEATTEVRYRYPPRNGGNYFASHFIMGGEKFDSPVPESFLFGDNTDLNLLGPKPVAFPYPPPQSNEPTKTLRSLVHIRRDSVHFVQADSSTSENRAYNIEFTFDSDVKCAITIYYFAIEDTTSSGIALKTNRKELTSDTFEYERGASQVFKQPSHCFHPSDVMTELQEDDSNPDVIPIAIHCVALEGPRPRQSQTTLCIVESFSDNSYTLKALKQKIFADGLSYLLQEIYGIENKIESTRNNSDEDVEDSGAECVVCMSDLRDTLILPCRHLCLCNACADSLRYQANNCPICRAPFRALLQIRAVQKINHAAHPALAAASSELDEADDAVPPGYQAISLMEALNGPFSAAPPAPPPVQSLPSGEKKSKKSKSGRKRSKGSRQEQVQRQEAQATSVQAEESSENAPESGSSNVDNSNAARRGTLETDSSHVSVNIVNERGIGNSRQENKTSSLGNSSIDIVEEELTKMNVEESNDDIKPGSSGTRTPPAGPSGVYKIKAKSDVGDRGDYDDDNEIMDIEDLNDDVGHSNVGFQVSGSTRVSVPGTPNSFVSQRSIVITNASSTLQDSASTSSVSSTNPLLPPSSSSRKNSSGTNVPTSAGSAVIVRVHPRRDSSPVVSNLTDQDC